MLLLINSIKPASDPIRKTWDEEKLNELGISAEDIKRRVIDRLGAHRLPLAQRCEAAARFLHAMREKA